MLHDELDHSSSAAATVSVETDEEADDCSSGYQVLDVVDPQQSAKQKQQQLFFFYIGKSSLLLMRALDYNSEGVDALTMFRVGENFK